MIDEEKAEDRRRQRVRAFELPGTLCEGEPRVPTSLDDSKRHFISFILVEWLGFLGKKVLIEVEALTLLGFAFLDSRTS